MVVPDPIYPLHLLQPLPRPAPTLPPFDTGSHMTPLLPVPFSQPSADCSFLGLVWAFGTVLSGIRPVLLFRLEAWVLCVLGIFGGEWTGISVAGAQAGAPEFPGMKTFSVAWQALVGPNSVLPKFCFVSTKPNKWVKQTGQ